MPDLSFDPAFCRRLVAVHGPEAQAWIDGLPATIDRWRTTWTLGPPRPYPPTYNWVAAVDRSDGAPCVLKLSPPDARVLIPEAAWLALADGRGAVRLLADAAEEGALLLERVVPGTPLTALVPERDDDACAVFAQVIAAYQRPIDDDRDPRVAPLPALTERVAELSDHLHRYGDADPLPGGLVAGALEIADQLLVSAGPDVALHGDLHHDNVLLDRDRGWLAIDPHGLRGDPTYEPSALLYNPLRIGPLAAALAPRRCRVLAAATGFPEERIRAWGHVQAALSAVWSLDEDPDPDTHVLAVADALAP